MGVSVLVPTQMPSAIECGVLTTRMPSLAPRFVTTPPGLLCDLLWSDPDRDIIGWGENDRGVSFTFGEDIVVQFLRRHDLDLICRAHQVL